MLFRADFRDLNHSDPIKSAAAEFEHYNPEPPKLLPSDEHTTYTAQTDSQGVLASTLPESGWWAVTAIKPGDKIIQRCTFWVHVDDKIPLKPAE